MNSQEYIISFYSIFIGVAGSSIVINWARILKDYPEKKVSWGQLVWSLHFFLLLTWEWFIQRDGYSINTPLSLILSLINPVLIYSISYLILPQSSEEGEQSFESQKAKIAILTIIWSINKYYNPELSNWYLDTSRVQVILGALLFVFILFDKRKIIWDMASLVSLLYFIAIFTNFFGIGKRISVGLMSSVLILYLTYQAFMYLKRKKNRWLTTGLIFLVGTSFTLLYLNKTYLTLKFYSQNQRLQLEPLEKKIGARAHFENIPNGWVPLIKRDMTSIWESIGVEGMSYYSFGGAAPFRNYASRFDITSPDYQAWMGAYFIPAQQKQFSLEPDSVNVKQEIGINTFLKLGRLDQLAWLEAFNDPGPGLSILEKQVIDSFRVETISVPLYKIKFRSRSDLTTGKSELADFLGRPPTSQWAGKVDDFHDVVFHCYFATYYNKGNSCVIMVYAAAAEFSLKDGRRINNFEKIGDELLISFRSFQIEYLPSHY